MLGAWRNWWRPAEMTLGDFQLCCGTGMCSQRRELVWEGGREEESRGASQEDGEVWGATSSTDRCSLGVLGENLWCRTGRLGSQRVPDLPCSVCWGQMTTHQWPFLLRGCSPEGNKILPSSAFLFFSEFCDSVAAGADSCSSAEVL